MSNVIKIYGADNPHRHGDVIFVHGLNGDARATWQPVREPERFWPSWIGEDLLDVGVWSVNYPTNASAWKGSTMPLNNLAINVLSRLSDYGLGKSRPVIFITHSFGGLLVKQILRCSDDGSAPGLGDLAQWTRGVVFIATPHSGSSLANFLRNMVFLQPSINVKELQKGEPQLVQLSTWYRHNVMQLCIKTLVYRETKPTPAPHWLFGKFAKVHVVDETSADPAISGVTAVPLEEDHITICHPKNRDSQLYVGIRNFVNQHIILKTEHVKAVDKQLLSTADASSSVGVANGKESPPEDATNNRLLLDASIRSYPNETLDVVLSYACFDEHEVEFLAKRLRNEMGCQVLLDKWILTPNKSWYQKISQGLEQPKTSVMFVGSSESESWFRQEIKNALNRKSMDRQSIIPVILPNGDPRLLNEFPELIIWAYFRNSLQDNYAFNIIMSGIRGIPVGRYMQWLQDDNSERAYKQLEFNRDLMNGGLIDENR
jgi:TIR domain